ncbi:ubiquitin conjugation factor E4 A [Anoplophora glabripennis]|uniref:ubiquitin conjugation factor E4 A n=1 Tax=Anoplophora glabripennis TaxID=217634 RepID=UPI000874CC94|nr:ubiquitin conjugation factor E4 A [Anoplophora glabripennis]
MSGINPFTALFEDADSGNKREPSLNDILEDIFCFSINSDHSKAKNLVYLEEVRNVHEKEELDISLLHYALFERLFMCNENSELNSMDKTDSHAHETRVINYLYSAYKKLKECTALKAEDSDEIRDKIVQNVATAIIQPDLYSGQSIDNEMINILKEAGPHHDTFFVESSKKVLDEENNNTASLCKFIESMNKILTNELIKSSLISLDYSLFNYLNVMTPNETLAELFIECCFPSRINVGADYAITPIGALLNLSILPKVPGGKFDHFTDPMDQASNSRVEGILWANLDKLTQSIQNFLLSLLKCSSKVKNKTLSWLGSCLKSNVDRGKIWNSQAPPELNPANYTSVTDGFMINMCNVILRMCQPFTSYFKDNKILKVDPTYCSVPNEKTEARNIHMQDLSGETCFLPVASNEDLEEERLMASSYNFITECFYMCHKAIDLGYKVGVDKLVRQNHEMGRLERAFNDAVQQAGGNSDLVSTIRERMTDELSKYLSLKCQLSDPILMKNMFDFTSATSYWLCQVAVHDDLSDPNSYAPLNELPINFPLSSKIPNTLKCIPEFLVENVVSFLVFTRRFTPKTFEQQGFDKLRPLLTFILIYMGSQHHMKNPHLRARLAEGLESLLPFHKDEPPGNNLGGYQRQMLFTQHPHKLQIVENLMNVFVGIEMTGQSVEFEQKFNYRRPMYTVFDYLWELGEHRERFRKLADEAEKNMEAVNPPLFLKFSNLLINDAIFLLDEALANMAKLKEMQQAQDNGEWSQLSARERTQNISYMHHIGNLARFDNILGRDTIITLEKLTSEISIVFTHSTIVDRIAAMLNYFLLNLVGPNKKNFKVKDSKEYHFDPAGTVLEICKIYVHLKDSDAFCLAVSQDGRSYSPTLFSLAEDVMVRIGGGPLIGELKEVADKVAQKALEHKANEEAMMEAPDHFLDPIMSTIMTDPVILPSSKQTVDRTTIARHLLSDQTDPFNRSPLSMEQVIPNKELAEEIRKWVGERKAN